MRKNLYPDVVRAIRFGLLFALIGAAVMACGGGGKNGAPTELQANPTSAWEVITAGDIAQCNLQVAGKSNAEKTAQLIERQLAGAGSNSNVLTLGDNAYFIGLLIGYTECYEKTWGRFINKTFAIPGNHDYEKGGKDNYFDYFGAKANPDGKGTGYYRVDQSGWTLFTLNSNIDASAASVQAQWLKNELLTAKPCVAAAWHHARFTSAERGDNGIMTDIWGILDQAKADVVLAAHEHFYERFAPMTFDGTVPAAGGIRSFVVGTGGADIYAHSSIRAGSEKQAVTFGVLRLSLSPGNAKWRYVDINDAVLDAGTFDCRTK